MRVTSVGALVTSALLSGCATAPHAQSTFEYRIIKGYTGSDLRGRPGLEPLLESAGAEGWEAVSWTQSGEGSTHFTVLLKRPKH
jgi:hypothetical protein